MHDPCPSEYDDNGVQCFPKPGHTYTCPSGYQLIDKNLPTCYPICPEGTRYDIPGAPTYCLSDDISTPLGPSIVNPKSKPMT
jgi:hypothetical protein